MKIVFGDAKVFPVVVQTGFQKFLDFRVPSTEISLQKSFDRDPLTEILSQKSFCRNPLTEILRHKSVYRNPLTEISLQKSFDRNSFTEILWQKIFYRNPFTEIFLQKSFYRNPLTEILWQKSLQAWISQKNQPPNILQQKLSPQLTHLKERSLNNHVPNAKDADKISSKDAMKINLWCTCECSSIQIKKYFDQDQMVIPCKSKKKKGMMVKLVASFSRESFKEMNRKGRNGLNTVNIEQGEFSRTVSRIRFYIVRHLL